MIQADNCLLEVRESMDQQLMRLTECGSGGGSVISPIVYETTAKPVLYEMPQGLPVNAPIDATKLEPGTPITNDPAPATTAATTTVTTTEPVKKGIMDWVKENPLVAAGGGIVLLYLLTRKKGRKK